MLTARNARNLALRVDRDLFAIERIADCAVIQAALNPIVNRLFGFL